MQKITVPLNLSMLKILSLLLMSFNVAVLINSSPFYFELLESNLSVRFFILLDCILKNELDFLVCRTFVTCGNNLDFFEQFYSGSYKKGSRDYYLGKYGFEAFLFNCEQFERAMRAAQKDIPEYGTQEYWNALQEWLAGQEGSTRL